MVFWLSRSSNSGPLPAPQNLAIFVLSRVWLCGTMNYSLPGFPVHGISQARILKWVAISFSRGSSQLRDQTWVSCITDGFFTTEPPGKPISFCNYVRRTRWFWLWGIAERGCSLYSNDAVFDHLDQYLLIIWNSHIKQSLIQTAFYKEATSMLLPILGPWVMTVTYR